MVVERLKIYIMIAWPYVFLIVLLSFLPLIFDQLPSLAKTLLYARMCVLGHFNRSVLRARCEPVSSYMRTQDTLSCP